MKVMLKTLPEDTHHNELEVLVDTDTWELLLRAPNFYTNTWEVRIPVDEIEQGIINARKVASRG